jgi:hypothetical protein
MVKNPTIAVLSIALISALTLSTASAEAKKVSAKDKAAAKAAFMEAKKLTKAEEDKLALPLYRKAYELSGHRPSAIVGLAQCERLNKMYEASIAHYREYLNTKPSKSQVKRTQETIAILEKLHAQAKVEKEEQQAKAKADEERRKKETEELAHALAKQMAVPPPPAPTGPGLGTNMSEDDSSSTWIWIALGIVAAGAGTTAYIMSSTPPADIYGGSSGVTLNP